VTGVVAWRRSYLEPSLSLSSRVLTSYIHEVLSTLLHVPGSTQEGQRSYAFGGEDCYVDVCATLGDAYVCVQEAEKPRSRGHPTSLKLAPRRHCALVHQQ
jgi:hypothetical protein